MNITVDKNALSRAAKLAADVADTKSAAGILDNVRLTVASGCLSIAATDLTTSVSSALSGTGKSTDGAVAVDAAMLRDAVKSFGGETVDLSLGEKLRLNLKSGSAKVSLLGIESERLPSLPKVGNPEMFGVKRAEFALAIRRSAYAVSTELTAQMPGLLVESDGEKVTLTGLSNYRIAVQSLPGALPNGTSVSVPRAGMLRIAAMVEDSEDSVTVGHIGEYLVARSGDVTVTVKLLSTQRFPYEQVVPTKTETIRLNREELLSAVRRGALVSTKDFADGFLLSVAKDRVVIESSNSTLGDVRSELTLSAPVAKSVAVGLTWRYLSDALAAVDSDEVDVFVGGPLEPIVIRPVGLVDQMHLIMVRHK